MKISEDRLQEMYDIAGVTKDKLHNSLRSMGIKHLKTKLMREGWSEDNPTKNYLEYILK